MSTSSLAISFGTTIFTRRTYRSTQQTLTSAQSSSNGNYPQNSNPMDVIDICFENNKTWATEKVEANPEYFTRWESSQSPEFIWIGCSDARVVPCDIIGKASGDVFVHRNVGNIVSLSDPNCMSALEYGIGSLKAKHVIICGQYGCNACNAAMTFPLETIGFTNGWISSIRAVCDKWSKELSLVPESKRLNMLCELNTLEQTRNVCLSYPVQNAWKNGQEVYVHALIYDAWTGLLRMLAPAIDSNTQTLAIDVALACITRSSCTSNSNAFFSSHTATYLKT